MSLAGYSLSRPLGLDLSISRRLWLRGQVEVITEILDTLLGKVPIETSSGKLFFHIALSFERVNGLHNVKIGHILICQLQAIGE